MKEDLKACPFCGSEEYLEVEEFTDNDYVPPKKLCWVECKNCFTRGPDKGCKEAAIEGWNKRA